MTSQSVPGRSTRVQRWARLTVGLCLSAVFLILAFKDVPFAALWDALVQAQPLYILLALVCVNLVNVAKAVRWQVILRPQAPNLRLARLFAVIMIGQAMNAFAPLRVGDIARAYMVKGVGVGTLLYSVVIEKAWDSLILLATLAGVALVVPLPGWLKQSGIVFSMALVVLMLALIMAGRGSRYLAAGAGRLEKSWPPVRRLALARRAEAAGQAVAALGQGRLLGALLGWTVLSWLLGIGANALTLRAMAVQVANPALVSTFLIVVLYLGAIVPASPGKVGVFHYLVVLALAIFGVDRVPALAYAVVLHLVVYGPTALLGAYFVWRESRERSRV